VTQVMITIFIDQPPKFIVFQKIAFCAGIKLFSSLSLSVTSLSNDKHNLK